MSRTDLVSTLDRVGLEHEEPHVVRGARSGIPIVVAVHSTTRGPAIGGAGSRRTDPLATAWPTRCGSPAR